MAEEPGLPVQPATTDPIPDPVPLAVPQELAGIYRMGAKNITGHKLRRLRQEEMLEAMHRYDHAEQKGGLPEISEALGNLIVVAIETALTYGVPLDAVVSELIFTKGPGTHVFDAKEVLDRYGYRKDGIDG